MFNLVWMIGVSFFSIAISDCLLRRHLRRNLRRRHLRRRRPHYHQHHPHHEYAMHALLLLRCSPFAIAAAAAAPN